MSSVRSGVRPMSAKAPSSTRGLIAKTFGDKANPNSVDRVAQIWTAFGKYIAKTIKSGKGVSIPKLGNFTFTPCLVDLAGSTNPASRDKQIREPIFQIAKDFVLGMPIQSGVVHENGVLRPFEIRGTSGIVPKVRINFTEIGYYAGMSKEDAKHGWDIVIRDLSDKVKSGQSTNLLIPNVGNFIWKSKVAGVKFNKDVIEDSKGKTSKAHFVNKLFSSSVNRANLDLLDKKVSVGLRPGLAMFNNSNKRMPVVAKHDHTITVTNEAENWMKKNLGLTLDGGLPSEIRDKASKKMKRTYSARPGFRSTQSEHHFKSTNNDDLERDIPDTFGAQPPNLNKDFKIRPSSKGRRPMSAYSGTSGRSRASLKSAASEVQKITRATALGYCSRIATKAVLDNVKNSKFSARDKLSPSELQSILLNSGIKIDIATMRGLLYHMNFTAHGKSCSILDLIRRCKQWNAASQSAGQIDFTTREESTPLETVPELIGKVKDWFYKTGKTMRDIFDSGVDDTGIVDEEAFVFLCKKYCYPVITEDHSRYVYKAVKRNLKTDLVFDDFNSIFGAVAPKHNYHIEGLRRIRDWMYKNGLTSDQAFDHISGSRARLSIDEFDKELKKLFMMTSPEVESIFVAIDENKDGFVDRNEWLDKVYEDSQNPLQLFREIVNEHNLNSDDLLFKMNIRIWDDPLDFTKFCKALRILDSSLTDQQLKAMAKSMKNSQNLVEVPVLIRNLVGKDYETVDFRDKVYKRIFNEIFESSNSKKKEQFRSLLVKFDDLNDGTIVAQDLQKVLTQVCTSVSARDIEKFTRFLEKDVRGRIDYTQFTNDLEKVKNYNPFKNLVSRIKSFMKQNNQNVDSFMRRLVLGEGQDSYNAEETKSSEDRKVSIKFFAKFLKSKVDKKSSEDELNRYAELMDIDTDGFISIHDLQSCLGNLNNEIFYKDNGATLVGSFKTILTEREKFFPKEPLSDDKALQVITRIKEALISKGISFRELFAKLDANNDEFLTFTEFSENIDPIVKLSPLVKEQLFALMDVNKIGMVDYESFLQTLKRTAVSGKAFRVEDNFNWEYQMVEKIKDWIKNEGITVEEAFKAFDRDFDGFIDVNDLKWILTHIIKVGDKTTINTTQLERLFKLLDFSKEGFIQRSDIQRLVENENPYLSTGKLSNSKFMVGTDTFDWKNNAIQQIGIELSKNKKFGSIADTFKAASKNLGKIRYKDFKEFLEENNALKGFNLTDQLLQQLFSEIDPHKKGFLVESDWNIAFSGFNWYEQLIVEIEHLISCSFSDIESAFEYFLIYTKTKTLDKHSFRSAINSLVGKKLSDREAAHLWMFFSRGESTINHDLFLDVFGGLMFNGVSTLRKTGKAMKTTTLVSKTASSSQWNNNVMEKFRKIIKSSNMKLREVFEAFDEDNNGLITPIEFRNAVRKLNLNLSAKEIDEIIKIVDRNMDGMIDWMEFSSKFTVKENEKLIEQRAKNKMAKLKEQMTMHMKSPQDAFLLFDKRKEGKLTFSNFNDLIIELSKLAKEEVPPFGIIKDMFDEIDIRKDGEIDEHEWNQTFIAVQEGDKRFSLKKLPANIAEFEVSRDAKIILDAIRRNRKFLIEKFTEVSPDGLHVSFEEAKEIIRALQRGKEIDDEQYKIIFKGAIKEGGVVEFKKLGRRL